jgi:hypothetical protein
MPELTSSDIADAKGAFIADVQRELTIRGDSSKTIHALMIEMRDRLQVVSRLSGPETRYRNRHGGLVNAKFAAEAIVEEASERDHMASFGPDPVEELSKRLISLGIPDKEARARAIGRVERLENGSVIAREADGSIAYRGPAPQPGRVLTAEQKAMFTDASNALRVAATAIVAERARGVAPPAFAMGVPQETSEDAVQVKRDFVRSAF